MTPTAALTLRDRSPALAADAFVARNAHALGMARGFRRPRRAPDVTVLCMMETGNLGAADGGTVDGTTMMAPVGSFGHGTHQGSTSPQIDGSFRSPAIQSREPAVVPNTSEDPRFADNAATRAGMGFYGGMPPPGPLGGHELGTLRIADVRPRQQLDRAGREPLTGPTQPVADDIERRRASPRTRDAQAA